MNPKVDITLRFKHSQKNGIVRQNQLTSYLNVLPVGCEGHLAPLH